MKPIPKEKEMKLPKGRKQYKGYPYAEAIKKSLCFSCPNSANCFKPDTERHPGLSFKPIVFCSNYPQ